MLASGSFFPDMFGSQQQLQAQFDVSGYFGMNNQTVPQPSNFLPFQPPLPSGSAMPSLTSFTRSYSPAPNCFAPSTINVNPALTKYPPPPPVIERVTAVKGPVPSTERSDKRSFVEVPNPANVKRVKYSNSFGQSLPDGSSLGISPVAETTFRGQPSRGHLTDYLRGLAESPTLPENVREKYREMLRQEEAKPDKSVIPIIISLLNSPTLAEEYKQRYREILMQLS
mmetsp:Transcript_1016/g.1916  ORF Transcript_1016/g.1916 Transcript_1016/m.1916 type:complete len:226 (-) Transcript_1016:624-1301(-)